MTAAEILKMIEAVYPSDTAKLDEIDARVWCYFNQNLEFISVRRSGNLACLVTKVRQIEESEEYQAGKTHVETNCPLFTRSRDALKKIRPPGDWACVMEGCGDSWWFDMSKNGFSTTQYGLATEELAELHAIVQATECERQHND